MAIAKSATILILFFALANYVNAGDISRVRPPVGQDIFGGKNHAKDVLLPGEKIVNVLSFGAKGDGVTDCTQ
ncbi:polygalacturonase-like, partial [Trifolium medium]|nr:polygalacturonase-like [Trifolium medium]